MLMLSRLGGYEWHRRRNGVPNRTEFRMTMGIFMLHSGRWDDAHEIA
jgi:hypothetical protein